MIGSDRELRLNLGYIRKIFTGWLKMVTIYRNYFKDCEKTKRDRNRIETRLKSRIIGLRLGSKHIWIG